MSMQASASTLSRRNFITKAGLFMAGGVAGGTGLAMASTTSKAPAAPPLPWPWPKLDPMEAGKRAYRSYLERHG